MMFSASNKFYKHINNAYLVPQKSVCYRYGCIHALLRSLRGNSHLYLNILLPISYTFNGFDLIFVGIGRISMQLPGASQLNFVLFFTTETSTHFAAQDV